MRLLLGPLLLCLLGVLPAYAKDQRDVGDHRRTLKRFARDADEQKKRTAAVRGLADLGTPEAADAMLPLFDDVFEHVRDHVVSAWIRMLRKHKTGELHTWFEKVALQSRVAAAREGAAVAMCLSSGSELADLVRAQVKTEKDPDVLMAWARQSRRLRGSPDLAGAFAPLLKHKDGHVVREAARAMAAFDEAAGAPALRKAWRHKAPMARGGITEALTLTGALNDEDVQRVLADKSDLPRIALALHTDALDWPGRGHDLCKQLLSDPSWRVRCAAVQGALRAWKPSWIHLAIAQLQQEKDPRVRDDLHRGLVTFTQMDVGTDADLWISWWAANGSRFVPGDRPDPDRAGRIRWRPALHDQSRNPRKTVVFFDVPLHTGRIAFVFDLSGSMKDDVDGGRTKMDLLREQFAKTLKDMSADARADLLVYRYPGGFPPKPALTRAFGKLLPFNKKNASKASAWLKKQHPKGWGAIYEPLTAIFGEDVDTVVLLSDGRPSRGKLDRDFRILQEYPYVNRLRRVQVNTILLGTKGADQKFMEELAEATGGRFRAVPK